jgi:hypothetical protein
MTRPYAKSTLPTHLLTKPHFTHMISCSLKRWRSRTRCSRWKLAMRLRR